MPEARTYVERLDPRTKLVAVLLIAFMILSSRSPGSLGIPAVLLAAGCLASPVTALFLLRRFLSVIWFLLVIIGINSFSTDGNVLFEISGLFATREGLAVGLVLSARIILLLVASLLFVRTTPVPEMVAAIETIPFRKRLGPLIQIVSISLNFVPMLIGTARRIKKAQIARGADIDSRLVHQIRFAFSAALPLFALAFSSSETLALAMEARCYEPSLPRSHFNTLALRINDTIVLAALGTIFCIHEWPSWLHLL